jgi:hypothetical protein
VVVVSAECPSHFWTMLSEMPLLPGNPDVDKAKADFERAQKVEEEFVKDFQGVDFTKR